MKKIIFLLGFIPHFIFGQHEIFTPHYKIYSVKDQKLVTITELTKAAANAQVIFFGENHDDSIGHYLENMLWFHLIYEYPNQMTLSLEMFERDVQGVMDEYLAGFIQEKHLIKEGRAWKNYRDYRAMVENAKSEKRPVICANTPNRYVNLAGRKGQSELNKLSKQAKINLPPLPYDTAQGAYLEKLRDIFGLNTIDSSGRNHGAPMTFRFIQSQCLWDAGMAYAMASHLKKNKTSKIFQVNGRFHSDEGFAVVQQLKKYVPKVKTLIISCGYSEDFIQPDWKKHEHLGDYIILTNPQVPRTY